MYQFYQKNNIYTIILFIYIVHHNKNCYHTSFAFIKVLHCYPLHLSFQPQYTRAHLSMINLKKIISEFRTKLLVTSYKDFFVLLLILYLTYSSQLLIHMYF